METVCGLSMIQEAMDVPGDLHGFLFDNGFTTEEKLRKVPQNLVSL